MLAAALAQLEGEGLRVLARAPVILTDPVGPALRRYANSAAVVETRLEPPALLALLKRVERAFGRRKGGRRWTSRVLDLDVILWSGGPWAEPGLTVPHPLFRTRDFVLASAAHIAPDWRDPVTGATVDALAQARRTEN